MSDVFTSDVALLEALSNSDRNALEALYDRYHDTLVHWIVSRGGIEADAEDVFQEAVMVVFEKSKDPGFCLSAALGTYIFGVSKRIWYKKSTQNKMTYELENEDGEIRNDITDTYDEDLNLHLERESQLKIMFDSLDQLGSPCKELLQSFYFKSLSMQEIAVKFNYTNAENAKTQKYKCLNRLKKYFFEKRNLTIENTVNK